MAALSSVASTPLGSKPASSPALLPTFSGRLQSTPTSSKAGLLTKWRSPIVPTLPTPHWITRYFLPTGTLSVVLSAGDVSVIASPLHARKVADRLDRLSAR